MTSVYSNPIIKWYAILTQNSSKTEVTKLHLPLPCNKNIFWLYISVYTLKNGKRSFHLTTVSTVFMVEHLRCVFEND